MKVNISIADMFPKQAKIVDAIISTPAEQTKIHVIRASRQAGKTEALIRLILKFISIPKTQGVVISASYIQYLELFNKVLSYFPSGIISEIKKGEETIVFINGSKIQFFTGNNPNSVRGKSSDFIIMDEAALYPKDAIDTIIATVAARPKSKIVIASTPKGKNDFHRYCMSATDTDPFVREYRMLYTDNPYYDLKLVAGLKNTMTEFMFNQEFLAEFIWGKGQVFGDFTPAQKVTTWGTPVLGKKYFFAIDVAASGEDSTILTILDENGVVQEIFEPTNTRIPSQVVELATVIRKWNNAEGYGECNGLGLGLVESLQDIGINITKFWNTNERKQEMVSQMLADLAGNFISLPTIELYPKLDNEMSTYIVTRTPTGKLTYSHDKGLHDDTVDSLLIANLYKHQYLFGKVSVYEPNTEPEFIINGRKLYTEEDYSELY
jgi:hypothetical protein